VGNEVVHVGVIEDDGGPRVESTDANGVYQKKYCGIKTDGGNQVTYMS